jgi:DNA polymerase-3 subunit delta'
MLDLFGSSSSKTIPCGECLSCRKIFEGKSPDVKIVGLEDDKVTIGVETVRNVKNDMFTAPNDLSVKVYIIENADVMTEQAQNAFLLSLEEPPEYVLFFLLCENASKLLETVLSRAPTLRTVKNSPEDVESFLLRTDSRAKELREQNVEEFKLLVFLADGSIGRALELLDVKKRTKVLEHRADAEKIISLLSARNPAAAFDTISRFGTKRHDVQSKLSYLQFALRDLVLLKKSDDAPLCFFSDREAALELSTRYTASSLLALYDSTLTASEDLAQNSNVKLTLMNMLRKASLI